MEEEIGTATIRGPSPSPPGPAGQIPGKYLTKGWKAGGFPPFAKRAESPMITGVFADSCGLGKGIEKGFLSLKIPRE